MLSARPRFPRCEHSPPLSLLRPVRQTRFPVDHTICSGCHAVRRLVQNAEQAAIQKNPQERIIRLRDKSPREVVIEATSEKLPRRMRRTQPRMFRGTLRIRFPQQDKLVRLYWHRDAGEVSS
jgi:hypothetical protein